MIPTLLPLILISLAFALDVPPLTGRIVDRAHLLSHEQAAALTETMAAHERRTGNQIALLTILTLEGESVEEYAHRVASSWQLGAKGTDNGVLLLVVPQDRRIRIEVGYGLEGTLTDAKSSRIIREAIVPRFRDGDFSGGVQAGLDAIIGTIEGTYTPSERAPHRSLWDTFIIAVLVGVFVGMVFSRAWRPLGGAVSGVLSFALALPVGWRLAILAGVISMILAAAFPIGMGRTRRRDQGWAESWPGGIGGGLGGWGSDRSSDSFGGGGGGFGGGGASGRW